MSALVQSFVPTPPVAVALAVVSAILVVEIASFRSHLRGRASVTGRSIPDSFPPSDRSGGASIVRTDGGESPTGAPDTTGGSSPTVIDLTALPRPDTDGANDADVAAAVAAVESRPRGVDVTIDVADVETEADDDEVAAAVASLEADLC